MSEINLSGLPTDIPFHELNRIGRLLGQAFEKSPSYAYIFKETKLGEERIAAVQFLLQRNVWLHAPYNVSFVLYAKDLPAKIRDSVPGFQDDEPVCFFMCINTADHTPVSTWQMIKAGLLGLYYWYGRATVNRLTLTKSSYETQNRSIWGQNGISNKNQDFLYHLHNVVVHPKLQGKGVGSMCMRELFSRLKARHTQGSIKINLATQEEINVKFYTALGFSVVAERDFSDPNSSDTDSVHSWFMEKVL